MVAWVMTRDCYTGTGGCCRCSNSVLETVGTGTMVRLLETADFAEAKVGVRVVQEGVAVPAVATLVVAVAVAVVVVVVVVVETVVDFDGGVCGIAFLFLFELTQQHGHDLCVVVFLHRYLQTCAFFFVFFSFCGACFFVAEILLVVVVVVHCHCLLFSCSCCYR